MVGTDLYLDEDAGLPEQEGDVGYALEKFMKTGQGKYSTEM